jgi:hypothetical protein
LEETLLLFPLSIHNEEGNFTSHDRLKYFGFVAIGSDEQRFHVFADGFDWKALYIFVQQLCESNVVVFG